MYTKNCYKPKEFAELLGVTVKTLQNWDYSGKLIAKRSPSNRRYYTSEQLASCQNLKIDDTRKTVIYARVSTKNQKDDLQNQIEFLKTYCNASGIIVDECIQDFGSGMDYNREKWNNLVNDVIDGKIKTIVISNKDRFIRFGYDWFERLCEKFGTTITVVNNESTSPQKELVDDIISILHVFSCRLYGLRKYKKQISEDTDLDKSI